MPPTRSGKRLCRFTEKLQSEFTFLKKVRNDNDYDVYCTICSSSFSVSHGGRADVTDHLKRNKHKTAKQVATSSSVSNYFTPLKADDNTLKLAAKEVTFVYHTISHSQSFNSMTCTSTLIRKLFDEKNLTAARTKTREVTVNDQILGNKSLFKQVHGSANAKYVVKSTEETMDSESSKD